MDSPERTDDLDREVAWLRTMLHDDRTIPPGMVSRLQAAVAKEAEEDAPVGWKPRVVVACLAYVALGAGAAPAVVPGGSMGMTAAIALAYACLASWPAKRRQFPTA